MSYQDLRFVAGLHGNELAPYFALMELGVPCLLGHPRAAFERKRFIERDLNASFGGDGVTLEERRAQEILTLLPGDKPLVDLHTFSCESPPFAIVVDSSMIELATTLGISRVVVMSHDIKSGRSLIGQRSGVSIEVGHHDSLAAYQVTQTLLSGAVSGTASPLELYEAIGIITEPGDYANFVPHQEGFVPVLSGEVAYEHFGLRARRVR